MSENNHTPTNDGTLHTTPHTRGEGGEMTWEQCQKLRWKQIDERVWELHTEGALMARIEFDRGTYRWSTTNGAFDWHPGLRGAMGAARRNWWMRLNNGYRYAPRGV